MHAIFEIQTATPPLLRGFVASFPPPRESGSRVSFSSLYIMRLLRLFHFSAPSSPFLGPPLPPPVGHAVTTWQPLDYSEARMSSNGPSRGDRGMPLEKHATRMACLLHLRVAGPPVTLPVTIPDVLPRLAACPTCWFSRMITSIDVGSTLRRLSAKAGSSHDLPHRYRL